MNYFITSLCCLFFISSFSQTTYYTTNGKNRLTKAEANQKLSQQVAKMSTALGKTMYGSFKVIEKKTKKDSIISRISFVVSDKSSHDLSFGKVSEYENKKFPNVELTNLSNEKVNLEQLNGKPTMINFWFARCKPCIDEMPILNKIKEKYKDEVNFVSITYETKEDVAKFLKKHPFNFEHFTDARGFIDTLEIKAYPTNLFLDKSGILKYVKGGIPYKRKEGGKPIIGDGEEFRNILEELK